MSPVAEQMSRVLKLGRSPWYSPSPRLYHRMALAMEDAGFETRDQYSWRHTRAEQFKAFGMTHFINQKIT